MEIDISLEAVHPKAETEAVCARGGHGHNLLGWLAALGTGIAFGVVLASCFLAGQSEEVASVEILVSDGPLAKRNAANEAESVRPVDAIVRDERPGRLLAESAVGGSQIAKY